VQGFEFVATNVQWSDETDRNDGDGKSEWIHRYEDENLPGVKVHKRPIVCTNTTGTGIWFCGGTYSVIDGWLGG
jgi:hypothetical protein